MHSRIMSGCCQLLIVHAESAEPEPLLAHRTIELPIPIERRLQDSADGKTGGSSSMPSRGTLTHLQKRHHGSNLARRQIRITVSHYHCETRVQLSGVPRST